MSAESLSPENPADERDFLRLDFAVLGLPRSGTTWAANWLTTDNSICWHDPIEHSAPLDIERRKSNAKYRGISCTGSWMFNWEPPARTIVLERPLDEINRSLAELGVDSISGEMIAAFEWVSGRRYPHGALFDDRAKEIWEYLLPAIPFNNERHDELVKMSIQPNFGRMPDTTALRRIIKELRNGG